MSIVIFVKSLTNIVIYAFIFAMTPNPSI